MLILSTTLSQSATGLRNPKNGILISRQRLKSFALNSCVFEMAFRLPTRTEMSFPKTKPKKDKGYLAFLHELPCCVTGRHGVQAAHVSFPSPMHGSYGRGKGTKVPDAFALPLSPEEHAKQHGMNEREYWAKAGIEPHALANCLFVIYSIYPEQDAIERATARIYAGIKQEMSE